MSQNGDDDMPKLGSKMRPYNVAIPESYMEVFKEIQSMTGQSTPELIREALGFFVGHYIDGKQQVIHMESEERHAKAPN